MKINFAELKFKPSLFEPEVTIKDFHKQLANAIWQNKEIAAGDFALRIFNLPENNLTIEFGEQEKGFIKDALGGFLQWAQKPVLEAIGEKEGK